MRTHQLEDALRALKLFGILETLEARLAQAGAGELGHVELLGVLCADEAARRDTAGTLLAERFTTMRWTATSTASTLPAAAGPEQELSDARHDLEGPKGAWRRTARGRRGSASRTRGSCPAAHRRSGARAHHAIAELNPNVAPWRA